LGFVWLGEFRFGWVVLGWVGSGFGLGFVFGLGLDFGLSWVGCGLVVFVFGFDWVWLG
jgi:hypothetical protein